MLWDINKGKNKYIDKQAHPPYQTSLFKYLVVSELCIVLKGLKQKAGSISTILNYYCHQNHLLCPKAVPKRSGKSLIQVQLAHHYVFHSSLPKRH